MDRKGARAPVEKPGSPRTRRSRKTWWGAPLVLLVLLLAPVGVMVALGPPAACPHAGAAETVVWRVHAAYSFFESSLADAGKSALRQWQRHVVDARWGVEKVVLFGGLTFLTGFLFLSRRLGR